MKHTLTAAASVLLLLSSCSKGIDPESLDYISDFSDKGLALAAIEGMEVVVNKDYEPVTPFFNLVNECNGYYIGYNPAGKSVVMNGNYEPVDSASSYLSPITSAGLIWCSDGRGGVYAKDLRTAEIVMEESGVEFIQATETGSALLRRCGEHHIDVTRLAASRPAYDFMLVGPDGSILAPWGKYKYIDQFSNGMARFTNSATFYCVKTGKFAEDAFEDTERYHPHRFGYIDEKGRVAIPERYEMCDAFDYEGHARADETFGDSQPHIIIDKNGNVVGHYRPSRGGLY